MEAKDFSAYVKEENKVKNKLIDLNNHLFDALERLMDEDNTGEKLTEEIKRAKTVASIANQIIGNAKLALDAQIAINDGIIKTAPEMLGIKHEHKALE